MCVYTHYTFSGCSTSLCLNENMNTCLGNFFGLRHVVAGRHGMSVPVIGLPSLSLLCLPPSFIIYHLSPRSRHVIAICTHLAMWLTNHLLTMSRCHPTPLTLGVVTLWHFPVHIASFVTTQVLLQDSTTCRSTSAQRRCCHISAAVVVAFVPWCGCGCCCCSVVSLLTLLPSYIVVGELVSDIYWCCFLVLCLCCCCRHNIAAVVVAVAPCWRCICCSCQTKASAATAH